jgi:hypothetical protein
MNFDKFNRFFKPGRDYGPVFIDLAAAVCVGGIGNRLAAKGIRHPVSCAVRGDIFSALARAFLWKSCR